MAKNNGSQYKDPTSLASVADLQRRYPELVVDLEPTVLADILAEATSHLEDRTGRRLAPFKGHVFQERLFGIDPGEYGNNADMPMDIFGSLGLSQAIALGASTLVRHFWLDHFAPVYPELWTYTITSMQILRTYGDVQPIDFAHGGVRGPDVTDGHVWIRLGTFAPEGSRVEVIYDGGYTHGIPPSLRRACLFQAAKFIILEFEPQTRREMNLDEIDKQVDYLIGPWIRG
jgi:hypothetical protein